jgi:hypothetical protein
MRMKTNHEEHEGIWLDALFDVHAEKEFGGQDLDATMATVVPECTSTNVPSMVGALGGESDSQAIAAAHGVGSHPVRGTRSA